MAAVPRGAGARRPPVPPGHPDPRGFQLPVAAMRVPLAPQPSGSRPLLPVQLLLGLPDGQHSFVQRLQPPGLLPAPRARALWGGTASHGTRHDGHAGEGRTEGELGCWGASEWGPGVVPSSSPCPPHGSPRDRAIRMGGGAGRGARGLSGGPRLSCPGRQKWPRGAHHCGGGDQRATGRETPRPLHPAPPSAMGTGLGSPPPAHTLVCPGLREAPEAAGGGGSSWALAPPEVPSHLPAAHRGRSSRPRPRARDRTRAWSRCSPWPGCGRRAGRWPCGAAGRGPASAGRRRCWAGSAPRPPHPTGTCSTWAGHARRPSESSAACASHLPAAPQARHLGTCRLLPAWASPRASVSSPGEWAQALTP